MKECSVSIIVPAYNVEIYITRCLDSLLNQDFEDDYEIVVVNDGSTDRTLQIIKDHYSSNKKIMILDKENGGLSDARNFGIKMACGKYLMFVDADDYVSKSFISTAFYNINDCDICIFGLEKMLDDKPVYCDMPKKKTIINQETFWKYFYYDHPIICTTAVTKIYKKTLFDNCLFKKGVFHEDVDILHKIIDQCSKISLIDCCLYIYCVRDGSITNTNDWLKQIFIIKALQERNFYFLFNKPTKRFSFFNFIEILASYRNILMASTDIPLEAIKCISEDCFYSKSQKRIVHRLLKRNINYQKNYILFLSYIKTFILKLRPRKT